MIKIFQQHNQMDGTNANVCVCSHHKFIPILVILFGVLFLLQTLGIVNAYVTSLVWPILVVVAGGMKMMEGKHKCC